MHGLGKPGFHAIEVRPKDGFGHNLDDRHDRELEHINGFAPLFVHLSLHLALEVLNGALVRGGGGPRGKDLDA